MIVAYLCEPQRGGTFTFFQNARKGLKPLGIDFRCVPPVPRRLYIGSYYMNYDGVDYMDLPEDMGAATRAVVDHLQSIGAQVAIVLPGCDLLSANLPRYLPRQIRCLTRVPGNNRGALAPVPKLLPDLNRVVAVSDRVRTDLVKSWRVDARLIEVIPNGVEVLPLAERVTVKEPLRLIFTGRLDDSHKGVFLLVDMMSRLRAMGVGAQLTVVGSGPDGDRLRDRVDAAGLRPMVRQMGAVKREDVQRFLREADVYVLPTRYEGSPNSVLEAMAAGCVPVVTYLEGITDVILQDGRCGILVGMGDSAGFCRAIQRLDGDRALLAKLRAAAHAEVAARYTVELMAARYAALFQKVVNEPERRRPSERLDRYEARDLLKPTWRAVVPAPVKNALRAWIEWGRQARLQVRARLRHDVAVLQTEEKPVKFLISRLLIRSGLNRWLFVAQPGYRLHFHASHRASALWIYPDDDAPEQEILRRYLRPGDVIVDIGANIGNLTLTASTVVGDKGRVHAVEAHPRIFQYLKENVALNGRANIVLHETALGASNSTVPFSDEKADAKNCIRPDGGPLRVTMKRLDDLLPDLMDVAMIKLDVEGCERDVLLGAPATLGRTACVLFECWDEHCARFGHTADDVMTLLRVAGFDVFRRASGGVWERVLPGARAPACENYIAVRDLKFFEERTGWVLPR